MHTYVRIIRLRQYTKLVPLNGRQGSQPQLVEAAAAPAAAENQAKSKGKPGAGKGKAKGAKDEGGFNPEVETTNGKGDRARSPAS